MERQERDSEFSGTLGDVTDYPTIMQEPELIPEPVIHDVQVSSSEHILSP